MASAPIPSTMRAWTHNVRGAPASVLKLTELPAPVIDANKSTEVLVRISNAALNPGGSIMMHLAPFLFRHSPAIPEMDFTGTIVSSGCGDLEPGTEVFGSILVPRHLGTGSGALAEYVVVGKENVVRRPMGVKAEEAAGLGVAGCTALSLIEKAQLKSGDAVLVNGASGGIGTLVVQMAKDIVGESGRVVAICSGRNVELVKGLGADEVIDYEAHSPVHGYLARRYKDSKFDCVIDAFGIVDIWLHCPDYLTERGLFVNVGIAFQDYTLSSVLYATYLFMLKFPLLPTWLGGVPRRYVTVTGFVNLEGLEKLRALVEEGKLRVVIDSVWDMEDALKGYERILSRRARGKVIIKTEQTVE